MARNPQKKKATKSDRANGSSPPPRKARSIKGVILLIVSVFFLAYMVYSGGTVVGYFSLVVGLVCGLMGASYIYESKKSRKISRN